MKNKNRLGGLFNQSISQTYGWFKKVGFSFKRNVVCSTFIFIRIGNNNKNKNNYNHNIINNKNDNNNNDESSGGGGWEES